VTPCSVVLAYKRCEGLCCLHDQGEDGASKILRNFCILPQHYTASQPRRTRLDLHNIDDKIIIKIITDKDRKKTWKEAVI